MAEREISEKKDNKKVQKKKNIFQKIAAVFARMGNGLKTFFGNLKAELKRVIWPDKKRLVQSTATVIVICLFAAIALYIVDTLLSTVLTGVGFYSPKTEVPAVTETVAETSEGA